MTRRSSQIHLVSVCACVAACGPTSTSTGGSSGGGDSSSTATGSLSAENTGAPFDCPGARWHEGNLSIDDSTDLEALRDVGGVTGWLEVWETSTLVDLEFLSCLQEVGAQEASASVTIGRNSALRSLHGLEQLATIGLEGADSARGGRIHIKDNPVLEQAEQLSSLQELGWLTLWKNPLLAQVEFPALRRVGLLDLGGLGGRFNTCAVPGASTDEMGLESVGHYPVLEFVEDLSIRHQTGIDSLAPFIEAAERGVTFEHAEFYENPALSDAEIEAFAAATGIEPLVCKNEPSDPEVCWQQGGPACGGD